MAYDEGLAERVGALLDGRDDLVVKKMFGGLCYMLSGHMCCGLVKDQLMVRVGPDGYQDALAQPHASEMDFTGRALKGMVYVSPEGIAEDRNLRAWVDRGIAFVTTLPPK